MRLFLYISLCLITFPSFGISITSVSNGDFNNVATWDCSCVPTNVDDVTIIHDVYSNTYVPMRDLTISNGSTYTNNAFVWVFGNLSVEAGSRWESTYVLIVEGDYIIDGVYNSTKGIVLDGADVLLGGTGTISTPNWLILRNGDKTIPATTNLTLPIGYGIYLYSNTGTVTNNGRIKTNWLAGFDYTTWVNAQNSVVEIATHSYNDYVLDATAQNNTVIFSGKNQYVKSTFNNKYYNLVLTASGGLYNKVLTSDVIVENDLYIVNTRLWSNGNNIEIKGDWINSGGKFNPGLDGVTFSGVDQLLSATNNFETFNDLRISNTGSLLLNTKISCKNNFWNQGTIDASGYIMAISGDWRNEGQFIHGDNTVRLVGAGVSSVIGATEFFNLVVKKIGSVDCLDEITIRDELRMKDGTLNTNGRVTLLSDVNGTARLDRVTNGLLNGDLIVQRYFATTTNDWHLLGAPVSGQSLVDWDDDLMTMGFPGSDFPSFYFNNVTYYDESYPGHKDEGLLNASSINESIGIGQGLRLYLPVEINTIDVKGPANIGNINLPVSYTDSGSALDDGWNLVANPYPSTINWNKSAGWNKSGINDAIYIWNPSNSQYTTFVGGVGTNGGSKFIPSTQAFWVQANSASPSILIKERAKAKNDIAIKKASAQDFFKVRIDSENGYYDECVIRVNPLATDTFDADFDALELRSPVEGVPSVSVKGIDEKSYSIFSFAYDGSMKILPIDVVVSESGTYQFSFDNLDRFRDYTCLSLYDAMTETFYPIEVDEVIDVALSEGESQNRFFIHVCPPIDVFSTASMPDKKIDSKVVVRSNSIEILLGTELSGVTSVAIHDLQGKLLFANEMYLKKESRLFLDKNNLKGVVLITVQNFNSEYITAQKVVME